MLTYYFGIWNKKNNLLDILLFKKKKLNKIEKIPKQKKY